VSCPALDLLKDAWGANIFYMHEWPIGIRQTGRAERGCIASRAEYIGWRHTLVTGEGEVRDGQNPSFRSRITSNVNRLTIEHLVRTKRHYSST
jgi:hypothetical protein